MPFYERGPVRIHYEEVGSGFPLLLIPGGGLNSALSSWQTASPFNPMERYKDDFRCICADLRNANPGQSSGPLEIDRPWDAYTDDQLGLMDHLGIREFLVMGFCIGGPMIHNLIRRAPERVVAAAMMQPSGFRPEIPDLFYQNNIKGWGPPLCEKRPDVTMDMVHDFLTSMYTNRADFVFTVSRDFVRSIQTPLLIAPDDVPAHPYKVAMEVASLAPKAEVTIYPWKDSPEHIDEVVEHARRFLKAHEPVTAGRQGQRPSLDVTALGGSPLPGGPSAEGGIQAPQWCGDPPRHAVPQGVCFRGLLGHLTALLHEAELVIDAQNPLLAPRTARERVLQQRGHIEEREWLTLRGDHQDIGARVDVEPLGSAFLEIVPSPPEHRVIHDPHGGDRMAHAPPLVGVLRVDMQVGRSGVGDEEMATICAEAQTMRIVDAAQYAIRLGVRVQGRRILIQQHVVGGVVAHGNPPPIRTHAHAIRDVEVFLQQDLTVSDRTTRVAIQQMPGDGMSAVVADQNLTPVFLDAGDYH